MTESLTRGLVAAQVAETVADYPLADNPYQQTRENQRDNLRDVGSVLDDEQFWHRLLHGGAEVHGFWHIPEIALSEWIARVPGLFWTKDSKAMRRVQPALIEEEAKEWITYRPLGKSQRVVGGVGTMKLSPSDDGYRLVTLTTSLNVSAGIPALVSPNLWEDVQLQEGAVISLSAEWRSMAERWARHFPSVQDIPRGYFVLDRAVKVRVSDQKAPLQIAPFSIMEYSSGSIQLLDFVYVTAYTNERNYRRQVSNFFEKYRGDMGRQGRYLLGCDVAEPLWEAWFNSPEELRRARPSELRLINARINDAVSGKEVLHALMDAIAGLPDVRPDDLRRFAVDAGINYQLMAGQGTLADESNRLVDAAVQSDRLAALLQIVLRERGTLHGMGR
jgi:hypothetical protein